MAYCVKCGAKVDDGIMACPYCGAQIPNVSGGYTGGSQTNGSNTCYGQNNSQENTYGQNNGQEYAYGQQGNGQTSRQSYGQNAQQRYQSGGYQQYGYGAVDFFDQNEVRQNKAMGVLSYLGILVLIPLLAGNKQSQYVKHHVNQGLVLFVLSSLVDLLEGDWVWGLHSIIHFGGGVFSWIFDILGLVFFILMVMGIVTACKGERKELPLIGKIKFFR